MKRGTKAALRRRAQGRCEYCRMPEAVIEGEFQIEHIVARQHRGGDGLDNLALACNWCNLLKGPNLASIDPETELPVLLFHPRQDVWDEHFELLGISIVGRTPAGRATAALLEMNAAERLRLRALLIARGRW